MNDRILFFEEPHQSGGSCRIELTEQQAIDWFRATHPDADYYDEEALMEFITVHWAGYKEIIKPTIEKITDKFLMEHGYDGLYNSDIECGCEVGDLMPCDAPCLDCKAGYKQEGPEFEEYDFFIGPTKKKGK